MSSFEFLERCNRAECESVRRLLNDWFSEYPKTDRKRLENELKQSDHNYQAAFWELYVYILLKRLGFRVEIHPELSEVTRRPDFRITNQSGDSMIVEAATTASRSEINPAAQNRKDSFLEVVDRIKHPLFQLWLSESGTPNSSPSARKIAESIRTWLDQLSHPDLLEIVEQGAYHLLPKTQFHVSGWTLEFQAYPRPVHRLEEENDQMISLHNNPFRKIDSAGALRDKVKEKATSYGELGTPYVVAVNMRDPFLDDIDVLNALFGEEAIEYTVGPQMDFNTKMTRQPNGVWIDKSGTQNTRISAVLLARSVSPHSVATARLELVHNPWAQFPLSDESLLKLTQYLPEGREMVKHPGVRPRDVFGLSNECPLDAV